MSCELVSSGEARHYTNPIERSLLELGVYISILALSSIIYLGEIQIESFTEDSMH